MSNVTRNKVKVKDRNNSTSSEIPQIFALFGISWTEYERGWGCRGDGWSFHKSQNDSVAYVKQYNDRLPKSVPHEYSSPDNDKGSLIEVSESLYNYVMRKGCVRLWSNNQDSYKTFDAKTLEKK